MSRIIIELFPESYNQLRKVLSTEHEDLWVKVGYNMAHNHMQFMADMDAELDTFTIPEMTINEVCEKYLVALRSRIGKPATKSLALLHAEATGRVIGSTQHIFGTPEEDAFREARAVWKARKEAGTGIIMLPIKSKH